MTQDDDTMRVMARLRALAARGLDLLDTYNVLENEHRYPMLRKALSTRWPPRDRAEAAFEYAEQLLREAGLDDDADRVAKVSVQAAGPGRKREKWFRREHDELIEAMQRALSKQPKLKVSQACQELAAQEPWCSLGVSVNGLRSRFSGIAKLNDMSPRQLAARLVEEALREQQDPGSMARTER
jgi:hypothetical protein